MELRGRIPPCAPYYFGQSPVSDAATCYRLVKAAKDFFDRPLNLQSYVFLTDADPGSAAGPGTCLGSKARSCEVFVADPAGPGFGGDTSIPY